MIRKAVYDDLPVLEELYENARKFMHTHGNPNQWNDGHPNRRDLAEDIKKGWLHVIEEDGQIQASFVFYIGEDPTYGVIDQGNWLNDNPYGVGHKVASRALKKGMGAKMVEYLKAQIPDVRMDTHADNVYMRNLLVKEGFKQVGIIYLANGDERIAYHYCAGDAV